MSAQSLSNISVYPFMEPDESVRSELKRRCTAPDGVQFADVVFRPDRNCLCLVERSKPGPGDPEGEWYVTYELMTMDGRPRQADHREVESVLSRVYGNTGVDKDWYAHLKQSERDAKDKSRMERYEHGKYTIRRMNKAAASWRTTTYAGAPAQLNVDLQYPCGHGEELMAAECAICSPDTRLSLFMR